MLVGYIKQMNNPMKWIDKIKYFFNIIEIQQLENGFIVKLPICEDNIIKRIDKTIEKLVRKLQKHKIDTIIFSDKLSKKTKDGISFSEEFIIQKSSMIIPKSGKEVSLECNIISGRKIIEYMQFHVLEYILNIQKRDIRMEDVYFLIKKDPRLDLEFLDEFIKKCKTVNIITNDIERFRKIQHHLYEQENILISVSNNKSKALKRARYIFNINMDKKDLEKLRICRNAIIINIFQEFKYDSNCFNGININQVQIKIPDEYIEKLEKVNEIDTDQINQGKFYEAILLEKIEEEKRKSLVQYENNIKESYFTLANDVMKKDEVKISALIGNNGKIEIEELVENEKKIIRNEEKVI